MRHGWIVLAVLLCGVPNLQAADGPDKAMDEAVERALKYLHNTQDKKDGSWRSAGGKDGAITSLAVMAFLSAGHVPGEGPYGEAVEKGVAWVLRQQKPSG